MRLGSSIIGKCSLILGIICAGLAIATEEAAAITLNFSDPVGSGSGIGETALYSNIGTQDGVGVDVLATIIDQGPISQNNGLNAASGDLRASLAAGVINATTWMTVTYEFFETGTNTPITLSDLGLTVDDLDGYYNRIESIETSGVRAYTLNNPTGVMGEVSGDVYTFTGAANHDTGDSEGAVNIQYLDSASIWIKYQSELNVTGGAAAFYHDGAGGFAFDNPVVTDLLPRLYYTYNFNHDGDEPVAVDFFDSLPDGVIWDSSYEPVASEGLTADVVYSNANRDAAIPGMMMPPGDSTLTLRTITTSRTGVVENDATITPVDPNQELIVADASINLDPLGNAGPTGGPVLSEKGDSLWALAEDGNGRLVEFRNYKSPSVAITDWGPIHYNNYGTLTLFSSPSELESLTITGAGIAYFARNYATSIDGKTYQRPLFSLDIEALQAGDTLVATVVGDLGAKLTELAINSSGYVTGLAIHPSTQALYLCYDGSGGDGCLMTIDSFAADANGQLTDLTFIGRMSSPGNETKGVEDIAFAPDGTLYLTDRTSDKISTVDPDTAEILSVVSAETDPGDSDISKIEGLAVDPKDNDIVISQTHGLYADWMMSLNPGLDNNTPYFDYDTLFGLGDIEGMAFYTYEISPASTLPTSPTNVFDYGMYSENQVHIHSIGMIDVSGGLRSETKKISISSSSMNITGGMKARAKITIGGSSSGTVSGDLISEAVVLVDAAVTHNGAVQTGSIGDLELFKLPAPTGPNDPNYAHPITFVIGDYTIDGPLALEGTIYATGHILIGAGNSITGSGALVAGKQVRINGVNSSVGNSADGLFLYSLTQQIHFNGCNDVTVNGVCYAPNAQIHFNSTANVNITGGIYAGGQIHLSDMDSITFKPGSSYMDVIPPGILDFVLGD